MKGFRAFLSVLFLEGALGLSNAPAWGEGVLMKVSADPQGNYCHMKFPAIREDTLDWERPVLKDAGTGDIIDFYGPCNHDPQGKEEVRAQMVRWQRDHDRNTAD